MIAALLSALLIAAGQPADVPEDDNTTFSEHQPVRLQPVPASRAFAAFRDVCMAEFPDPAAFDRAAAASELGFVRTQDTDARTREWSSRHGQIVLRQARNPGREARRDRREGHARRERWRERCDFWVAIEERMEPAALIAAIGAALAPQARPVEEILGYSWELESSVPGTSLRLVYLPTEDDPRLFTLSLQRLAEAPAR
jgi:hypothetical protein